MWLTWKAWEMNQLPAVILAAKKALWQMVFYYKVRVEYPKSGMFYPSRTYQSNCYVRRWMYWIKTEFLVRIEIAV
jgi:hypothetical protein